MFFWTTLAFKNIFRQRQRSLLVGVSMLVASLFIILCYSWGTGMTRQIEENMVLGSYGHLQVFSDEHVKDEEPGEINTFLDRPELTRDQVLDSAPEVENVLRSSKNVAGVHRRVSSKGLATNSDTRTSLVMFGIEPENETVLLRILRSQVKTLGPREAVLGENIAEKLDVDEGDYFNALFTDITGRTKSVNLRVKGVLGNTAPWFSTIAYVDLSYLQKMIGLRPDQLSELSVTLHDENKMLDVQRNLNEFFQGRGIENTAYNWKESGAALLDIAAGMSSMLIVTYIILFFTTSFGIMSAVLITVNERKKEIGSLVAIGMTFTEILKLLVLEVLLLSSIAAGVGCIVGKILVDYLASVGIPAGSNLTVSLMFGGDRLYMIWSNEILFISFVCVTTVSVVATLYPVTKIARKRPSIILRSA